MTAPPDAEPAKPDNDQAGDSQPEESRLRPAEENPWYVLATIWGEQEADLLELEFDEELHACNRRTWNRWFAQALTPEAIQGLIEKGADPEDFTPLSDPERADLQARAEARGHCLPDPGTPERPKHIDFTNTLFSGNFIASVFVWPGMANFAGATFRDMARFDSATFRGMANFAGATFRDVARFDSATFRGEADFASTTFRGWAEFDGATFRGEARFASTTFRGWAEFDGATFRGIARFASATFRGITRFTDATFRGIARFDGATFRGWAGFTDATFRGEARFDGATFRGIARFDSATFRGEADFDGATFRGEARFDGATFRGIARFDSATFRGEADFQRDAFESRTDFARAKFKGDVPDFRDRSFPHATDWRDATWPDPKTLDDPEDAKERYAALRHAMEEAGRFEHARDFFARQLACRRMRADWPERLAIDAYVALSDVGRSVVRPLAAWTLALLVAWFLQAAFLQPKEWPGPGAFAFDTVALALGGAVVVGSPVFDPRRSNALELELGEALFADFGCGTAAPAAVCAEVAAVGPEGAFMPKPRAIPDAMKLVQLLHTAFSALCLFLAGLGLRNWLRIS
jgi:uncharacterized protein YjbI with pentapeptide repeats